jgi:hypothetical protein
MGAAAIAIAIIIVIVVVSIVLGVYFSKKRCPKFGYKCPAPVVTPPPVPDVTPPPPAADTPPAVGTTRGETGKSSGMQPEMGGRKTAAMGGKVEQGAASGREEVQDTRYMTNDEHMAYKKQQADLRDADGPALTNDQLAQLQRDAGKKVEITRDPALGQRINQMAGQAMGGKVEQGGQATMVEMGGMKDGLKGLSFNKQVGGKIGKVEQVGQATMVEMGGMKSGKVEQGGQDPLSAYAAPQRGKDYSGTDVAKHRTNDPKKCAEYCTADQNCKFFVTSTNSQECWLKNNMGKSSNAGNRITYTKNGYLLPAAAENTADQTNVVVNKFGVGDAAKLMGFGTVGGRTTMGRVGAAQGYGGR